MLYFLKHPIKHVQFYYAWVRWVWSPPYRLGDPSLGAGELRKQNRDRLRKRWNEREPKPEDFGLHKEGV